uniref:Uncharacterized protein n=1 Tax=Triticum urartu TaxID=4572 RepID=A0A8R7QTP6_TRIUA
MRLGGEPYPPPLPFPNSSLSRRPRRRACRGEATAIPKEGDDGAPGLCRLGTGARRTLGAAALRHELRCRRRVADASCWLVAWLNGDAGRAPWCYLTPALLPPDAGSLHSSCIRRVGPRRGRSPALANKFIMISEVRSNGGVEEDF